MLLRVSAAVLVILLAVGLVWWFAPDSPRTGSSSPPPGSVPGTRARSPETEPQRAAAEPVAPETPQPEAPAPASSALVRAVLHGRLDDAVPRPIADGHVRVHMLASGPASEFDAGVRADGTFELADLPDGHAQVIALCRGWVSRRTPFDPVESATLRLGRELKPREIEQAFQEEPPESLEAQRIALPARAPLVVAMERTGSLVVTVHAPGPPLAGARVTAAPDVRWIGGGSMLFPWREWSATTDAAGRARLDDLPPAGSLRLQAEQPSFRMARGSGGGPSVEILSGQLASAELVLEPNDR